MSPHNGVGPAETTRLRVLVADDVRDAADSLCLLLRAWGYEPLAAYDGPSALRAAPTFRPDVFILDLAMPGLDGLELARRLRAAPEFARALLIALSGYAKGQDAEAARAAGFDHHLAKPAEADELHRLLAAHAAWKATRS
jgi:CheY-like chemotaxis protein